MAKRKSKSQLPIKFEKSMFEKPTTKHQREWNENIKRLARFESKHKGVDVYVPEKPIRVTKQAIKEIESLRGKKILEQSEIEFINDDVFTDVEKGRVNALSYFERVMGDRVNNISKPENARIFRSFLSHIRDVNNNTILNDEIEEDLTEPFAPMTENDITLLEFQSSIGNFRPEFQQIMQEWSREMQEIMGADGFAEELKEFIAETDGISRKEAYNKKALVEWERKFTERLAIGSEMRDRAESYLNKIESSEDISAEYEGIQQYAWSTRGYHTTRKNW